MGPGKTLKELFIGTQNKVMSQGDFDAARENSSLPDTLLAHGAEDGNLDDLLAEAHHQTGTPVNTNSGHTRTEIWTEGIRVIVPRAALGALAVFGGSFLLWGTPNEPSPQTTPSHLVQPPSISHEDR